MNNKVINVLAFSVGAAIGSVVTWKVVETKYKKIAQEEIDSVKEVFSKKATALHNEVAKAHACLEANKNADKNPSYTKVVNDLGYQQETEKEDDVKNNDIYVIPPESFGEVGYEEVSLTYYADGILAYDDDSIVRNVDKVVGVGSLNTFGEYEDDSVFVRDDEHKIDYEILRDTRSYATVVGSEPDYSESVDE